MKYSPTTGGFYIEGRHKDIPEDAITLTQTEYEDLYFKLSNDHEVKIEGGKVTTVPRAPAPVAVNRLEEIQLLLAKIDLDSIRWLREKNDAELKKLDDKAKALIAEMGKIKP